MTGKSADCFIRNDREARIAARADRLAAIFAKRAAAHDRAGSFPFDNFADLMQDGYLKLTVPKEFGGDEISLYEMLLAQERLAAGDGSTALAVGWHVGLMLHWRVVRNWPPDLFARICRDVVEAGKMLNQFSSEPLGGSPSRGGKPKTLAVRTDGGWRISGRKTFSTLSPILDRFIVSATIDGTDSVGEFLVEKSDAVTIEETWDTLGMRATGSHDVVLDQAFVPESHLISIKGEGAGKAATDDGGGWLLHIPACYLGIAQAARDYAIRFASRYQPNSLNYPIAQLPHIQQQIGNMEEELLVARTFLYSVADRWDKFPEQRSALRPELGLAKKLVTNNALLIVDRAMRIAGGASLSRSVPLERYYRDVRAGLHNPPMDDAVVRMLALRALDEAAEGN
jgi:alkylation response protein AidB-like acyl-CoA dehydrogenase